VKEKRILHFKKRKEKRPKVKKSLKKSYRLLQVHNILEKNQDRKWTLANAAFEPL